MNTKTPFKELSTNLKHKKLAHLKNRLASGGALEQFTQEERDLLHMETCEENVLYWKRENERAESDERCLYCQSVARSIIVALRVREPLHDDIKDNILHELIAEAELLPAMH